MSDRSPPTSPPTDSLERLAAAVRRRGLTTPALMLLTVFRPLGFVGSHALLLVQPLAPDRQWQERIAQTAAALEDDATWTRLEKLLQ